MEEAINADKIVIIKNGEIVAQGTPNELKEQYASDELIITFNNNVNVNEIAELIDLEMTLVGDVYKMKLASTMDAIPIIQKISPFIASFEVLKGSLDHVFIQINDDK